MNWFRVLLLFIIVGFTNCSDSNDIDSTSLTRSIEMGFTTWSFGPELQDVNETYAFIGNNSSIYAEHIDNKIPWNSWMNDSSLPLEFTNEIDSRLARKIPNKQLLLSVTPLNLNRDDLAEDFDNSVPNYTSLSDAHIEDAYFDHVNYLVSRFEPDYLVIAIEVNELRLNSPEKWDSYTILIGNVKSRLKTVYPELKISESVTLHNLFDLTIPDAEIYTEQMFDYINEMDFAAISFYPFFKNLHLKSEFQDALNVLNSVITIPIAFAETSHIAENLIVPNLNLFIEGSSEEQKVYLETLLENADANAYIFVIWWAHRDYDSLWETFPQDLQDIGQLWRDSGLLDEQGNDRLSKAVWDSYLQQ